MMIKIITAIIVILMAGAIVIATRYFVAGHNIFYVLAFHDT